MAVDEWFYVRLIDIYVDNNTEPLEIWTKPTQEYP